jgi:hypothetical protein
LVSVTTECCDKVLNTHISIICFYKIKENKNEQE